MKLNLKTRIILVGTVLLAFINVNAQQLLNIDKSMEIAMQNSPEMKQVELSLVASRERLNAQRARLKSQLSLTLNPFEYEKTNRFDTRTSEWYLSERATSGGTFFINQRILPTDGTISLRNNFEYRYSLTESANAIEPISKTYNNNLSLVLTQPIFTYNKTKVEFEQVEFSYENTLLRFLLQKLNLEKSVAQQFYNVYSRQMRLNISKEELLNNEDSYKIIKNKVDGGLLALEELYQAEVNLASSRSDVFNAELNLQNSMDDFKVLIGMQLTDTFMILSEVKEKIIEVDGQKAITHAIENRMELRQREISIQNSMFDLMEAKTTNEFDGDITASFGVQMYNENLGDIINNPTNTPSVGIQFNIPIFDWGERKSQIKAAEANLQSAEIDLETEKIDIQVNIRAIVRSLKNLENQIEIQQKTVENAQLTYNINLERYRNGDLTSLDLGIYQNQLSDRKMGLTNAIIDYKLELLNLKIQSLYDFELGKSIVPQEFLDSKK